MKEELKKKDPKKISSAASNRRTFIKIYNNMCVNCKNKLMAKPMRPMSDYCDKCQEMMTKSLKGKYK